MNVPLRELATDPVGSGAATGRLAALRLEFAASSEGQTHVARQYASYPFHICRPFRYAGDPAGMASVYTQSASGGVYEHERLSIAIETGAGAAAHVTTQASTIVHEMQDGFAEQTIELHAGPDSWLEFLADPLILFPDARIETRLRLVAAAGARAIVGDAFLAHDPKGQDRPFGRVTGEIRIEREDGSTIAVDRLSVSGTNFCTALRQADRGFATHGSMLMLAPDGETAHALDAVRALLAAPQETPSEVYAGVSLLPQGAGLWTRAVARDGAALRRTMLAIWSAMRESMTGIAPAPRRK
ncbi:MAG: urease accessory protein UreD [Dongiaceae bacterium]